MNIYYEYINSTTSRNYQYLYDEPFLPGINVGCEYTLQFHFSIKHMSKQTIKRSYNIDYD